MENREQALKPRYSKLKERWSTNARRLDPLTVGDRVSVQDRHGNTPNRWSRRGTVVEIGDFDDYTLRLDGSRATTRRNRRHLRKTKERVVVADQQWPDWESAIAEHPAGERQPAAEKSEPVQEQLVEVPTEVQQPAVDPENEVDVNCPDPDPVPVIKDTAPEQRVSTRSTKGQSTRYDDYELSAVDINNECLKGMRCLKVDGGILYYNFIPNFEMNK